MKEFLTVIIPQKTSLYSLVNLRHARLKTRSGRARDGPVGERRRITPKEVSRRPGAEREAPFWTWRRCRTCVRVHRLCRTRARAHRPWKPALGHTGLAEPRARVHRPCRIHARAHRSCRTCVRALRPWRSTLLPRVPAARRGSRGGTRSVKHFTWAKPLVLLMSNFLITLPFIK